MVIGLGNPGSVPGSGSADAAGLIKDTTTATFMQDVVEASKSAIVLVDFWAPWCGPCKQLTPVIEKVVRSFGGKVRLVKMNIDEHPAIPQQMGVKSIPAVFAFANGQPVDGFQGAQPESQIKAFLDRLVGDAGGNDVDLTAAIEAAEEAFNGGDLQGAAEIYASVLEEERQNVAALAGLAKCYLATGDLARAEQTIALVPPDKKSAPEVTSILAAIDLAHKAGGAGDAAELERKLAADPADHQTRYDLAVAMGALGEKDKAVDHLIEIMRRNRNWNDDAARMQLLQFFELWGFKDPSAVEGRRKLSSILFS